MSHIWRKMLMCTALLSSTGCASLATGEDGESGSDDDASLGEVYIGPDEQMQGRHVLSKAMEDGPEGRRHLSLSTLAKRGTEPVTVRVVGAALQATDSAGTVYNGNHDFFNGLVLSDPGDPSRTLTIQDVTLDPGVPGRMLYTLEYKGSNPCAKTGSAIPLYGYYDDRAHHWAAKDRLSFACQDEGVGEKCVSWGFPPGTSANKPIWRAHQLCTRMAMADYCKDGDTYTLDETYIRIGDTYEDEYGNDIGFPAPTWQGPLYQPLTSWPPPPNVHKFEAAWPEDDDEPVTCLSKKRWQGLAPGALDSCPVPVPDPRQGSGQFCEDMIADRDSEIFDAYMVNTSKHTDILLEEWERADGERVSTIQGYWPGDWSGPGPRPVPVKAPFPPYTAHVETQGTLLRSLPGSISSGEVRDVWSYYDNSMTPPDRVLGRSDGPLWPAQSGYTQGVWEGLVFIAPPESGVPAVTPFFLYELAGDYFNSTAALGAPYTLVDVLGYVPVVAGP